MFWVISLNLLLLQLPGHTDHDLIVANVLMILLKFITPKIAWSRGW